MPRAQRVGSSNSGPLVKGPFLFLVTDVAYEDETVFRVVDAVARASLPMTFGVQLRDKKRDARTRATFGARLRARTRELGVPLVVNGDIELARAVGADGVHLGAEAHAGDDWTGRVRSVLGPSTWISVAAHNDSDVARALGHGVDAVFVSPVYDTPGKGPARGVAALASARSIVGSKLLLYALGGIDAESARACRDAGADGVAVIRALLSSSDPGAQARAILAAIARA
jgi:thiamine-phosphate pyrophosphorylase